MARLEKSCSIREYACKNMEANQNGIASYRQIYG